MQYLHNPRCSKSRQGLELLNNHTQQLDIVEYLKVPLQASELSSIADKLGVNDYREMMRTKEADYKELNLKDADQATLLSAMVSHPKLIERPILINGDKAVIGRPPEQLLDIV